MESLVLFVAPVEDVSPFFPKIKEMGIQIAITQDVTEALDTIQRRSPIGVFVREDMGPLAEELFALLSSRDVQFPLIVVYAAQADASKAKKYMNLGAWDFWLMPLSWEKIRVILESKRRELSLSETSDKAPMREMDISPLEIVGNDRKIRFALSLAKRVAPSNATVLIMGESGTGKELIARYIHANSPRASMPFVAVNCAALPENLLESELFGYEKGAFTGAYRSKPGKFELAHGGTILLDEITEMEISLQAKLLRVIQEREVDRVGGTHPIKVDVRILATTNRDIKEMMEQGRFREDLYYRLNVIPITLPPLRERGEDILILARHFLARYAKEYNLPMPSFSPQARQWLLEHKWPGNIRELQNLMERAILLSRGKEIQIKHFLIDPLMDEEIDIDEAQGYAGEGEGDDDVPMRSIQDDRIIPLEEMEKIMIVKSLEKTQGNRTRAAELLGISVRTLRNKLNKLREEGIVL